jgi:1-acyl-sn-glycerol-3-phosphate acyltransferase
MSHPLYLFVKFTSWIGLRSFFGGIDITGKDKIPDNAAIIFAPNHQGAFMDAMLVATNVKQSVHFLTRADIFKKPFVISLLNALHMMAIYRIRDGIQSLSQNDAVFEACFNMLSKGKAILIFPEGNHAYEYYLRPISKGTSRLALDAREAMDASRKLYIVPTGINYFSHRWPFAKVKIHFGDPIDADAYMETYRTNKQKAYNTFKEDLAVAMKKTLILAEEGENYEAKRDFIFQPKHEDLSFSELKAMGDAEKLGTRKVSTPSGFKNAMIAILSIFNLPPWLLLNKLLPIFKDPVFHISIKYFAGSLFHILWWSLIYALGTIFIGWEAGLLFVLTTMFMAYAKQGLKSY